MFNFSTEQRGKQGAAFQGLLVCKKLNESADRKQEDSEGGWEPIQNLSVCKKTQRISR